MEICSICRVELQKEKVEYSKVNNMQAFVGDVAVLDNYLDVISW